VTVTCRESASSCAALAASGTIMKMLNGFKNIFTDNDPRYRGSFNMENIHMHKILGHCIVNFYRLATRGIGSFYIIGDAINLTGGASCVSIVFQSEKTASVAVAGAITSLGVGRTTSAKFYSIVPYAVRHKSVAENPDGGTQEFGEGREPRKQFQKKTSCYGNL